MQSMKMIKQLDDLMEHKKYILDSCNRMSNWLFMQGKDKLGFELLERAVQHDNSKLEKEELDSLLQICESNKSLTNPKYIMTDYDKKCIEIHWKHNRHHPEHFDNIADMTELDVIEMVCDWYSRSRQLNTDLMEFVFTRQENRFKFPSEVFNLILLYCYILLGEEKELEENNMKDAFVFFHLPGEPNDYLSNWYNCKFKVDEIEFTSGEQYMMYAKATLFKDTEIAEQILKTNDFAEIKALGRKVKNFDNKTWDTNKVEIVYKGLLEKFKQNEDLKQRLIGTENKVLAECAVQDKIWGIGISMKDPDRFDINKWKGQNILGVILMRVREELRKGE